MRFPINLPKTTSFLNVPRIVLLDQRDKYFPAISGYIYYKITDKLHKQNKIPVCNLCQGIGFLYKGKPLYEWLVVELADLIADTFAAGICDYNTANLERFMKQIQDMLAKLVQALETKKSDEEIKLTGMRKCPQCHATGTKSLYLENFGSMLSELFMSDLISMNIMPQVNKLINHYLSIPPKFKNKRARTKFGDYEINKKAVKSKFISDLTKRVVGDFNVTNSFAALLKKWARVDTGAMKAGLFTHIESSNDLVKKVDISTTARKVSKNFPEGYLYAANFHNRGKTWGKESGTTKELFSKAFYSTLRKNKLANYESYHNDVYKLITLFDYNKFSDFSS